MKLGEENNTDGGGGGGHDVCLYPGQWSAAPDTGLVTLTEAALATLINTDPIDKWYQLDPEPIARGQFAVVYHCRHRVTGDEFAAKFSSRWRLGTDCTIDILHEVAVCAMLRPTQRTVQLRDVFSSENEMVLVMEYAAGGDLQTLLDENLVPYERDVISFTRQLLEGLVYIHDLNLVHLDIKPQNLVLMGDFPDCAVKLCDFEISRILTPGREVREILGTPDYVAPEILLYEPITKKTDMWSLGVLTYVLLTGFLPFGGDTDQETFLEISRGELDFPEELFEDISPEAIDFIKRLLVRQPECRMSARECLDHSWMKKQVTRPTPPSTLNLLVTTPATPVSVLPAISTPDLTSPTRDIGRPPFHPHTPIRHTPSLPEPSSSFPILASPITFMSSLLQRQESRTLSRHNLDRIRSMSKSREVLSERIQMSNLKKTISKSRERLFDGKLSLSKSRERLMGLRSFSQSVEVLSALSQLNQENSVYQSCNSIFLPMITYPHKDTDVTCRMYKSLASIDQIDQIGDCSHKLGYFESRFSKDDEDYNDLVTRHNTNLNTVIAIHDSSKTRHSGDNTNEARLRGGDRGGRGMECDKRCPRHNHRQPEAQSTQRIPKVNRAVCMKREAQRRRKEKKEREREEKEKKEREREENEKQQKSNLIHETTEVISRNINNIKTNNNHNNNNNKIIHEKSNEGSSSPGGRRRSVSHVEQRLAERHERQQEKQERQERQERAERRNSVSRRHRRNSVDLDRSPISERLRPGKTNNSTSLTITQERPRSTTPTRKLRSKKLSGVGSDVSQASSLESVNGNLDSPRIRPRPKRPTSLDLPTIKIITDKALRQSGDVSENIMQQDTSYGDTDEAYVSLDEPCTYIRDQTISNYSAVICDSTGAETTGQDTTELQENLINSDGNGSSSNSNKNLLNIYSADEIISDIEKNLQETSECGLVVSGELTVIREEEDIQPKQKTALLHMHSVSTSSDVGSMMSESSEGFEFDSRSPGTDTDLPPDWQHQSHTRSLSTQHGSSPTPTTPRGRSRSNSVHLEPAAGTNPSKPWGGVCDGSVARALEKFNMWSDDSNSPTGRNRRVSSPAGSPSAGEESTFIN